MIVEEIIMRYIAARCIMEHPDYMGVDLYRIYVEMCKGMHTTPTIKQGDFASRHVDIYHAMSVEEAAELLTPKGMKFTPARTA